jgi:hypothetical protein
LESRFDSGTTPSFLVFDASAPSSGTLSPSLIDPWPSLLLLNPQPSLHGVGPAGASSLADGIVFTVHYTVNANDGTYSSGAYGSVGLEAPKKQRHPLRDLTPEIVIGWVQEKLGGDEKVAEIQAALQAQIDQQRTPTTVVMACRGRKSQNWHRAIATPAREA